MKASAICDLAFHKNRCILLRNLVLHGGSDLAEFCKVTAKMARCEWTGGFSLAEAVDTLCITFIHMVFCLFVFLCSFRKIAERFPIVVDDNANNPREINGSSYSVQGFFATYPACKNEGSHNNLLFSLIRRVLPTTPHAPNVVSTLWLRANDDNIKRMASEQRASFGWTHQFLPLFILRSFLQNSSLKSCHLMHHTKTILLQ